MNSELVVIENARRILSEISAVNDGVRVVAATKTVPYELMTALLRAGITTVGENRVNEFTDKYRDGDGFTRHFIGQLQSNKAKLVVGRAELIHSLDRPALAQEINRLALRDGLVQDVLVEVNVGMEESKGGVFLNEVEDFVKTLECYEGIRVKGLMGVFPIVNEVETDTLHGRLADLFYELKSRGVGDMQWLSAGMSGDYMTAVRRGANMVRLGSAIFGPRQI